MAKIKKAYFCQSCGAQHPQWQGQCNACKTWNTLVEEVIEKETTTPNWSKETKNTLASPIPINEVDTAQIPRIKTNDLELDRVLGGGLVPGAVVLLGGEPGIGKSTLLLQLSLSLNKKVLYVSGEESQQQIKLRADRMGLSAESCFLLSQTETHKIFDQVPKLNPQLLIIDSIQTLHTPHIESGAGSVSQIKASAAELIKYAKTTNTPVILVGHIPNCNRMGFKAAEASKCCKNAFGSSALVRLRPDFPAMRNFRAGEGIASATATRIPARAACSAAIKPAGPAPTTNTSNWSCG